MEDGIGNAVVDNHDGTITINGKKIVATYDGNGYNGDNSVPNGVYTGFPYFDTDLGEPIWYNGNSWVDALGQPPYFTIGVSRLGVSSQIEEAAVTDNTYTNDSTLSS